MAEESIVLKVTIESGSQFGDIGAGRSQGQQSAAGSSSDRARESRRKAESRIQLAEFDKFEKLGGRLSVEEKIIRDSLRKRAAGVGIGIDPSSDFGDLGGQGSTFAASQAAASAAGAAAGASRARRGARPLPGVADPTRRRRGRPGRGFLGAALASGGAGAGAALGRPLGGAVAGALGSGGAIAGARLAGALGGPIGIAAVAGLTAAFIPLTAAVGAATRAFREIESLGEVNAEIAQAQALRDVRDVLGRIRRGRQIGTEAAGFISARSELDQALKDAGAEILEEFLPILTTIAETSTEVVRRVEPLIPALSEGMKNLADFAIQSHPVWGALSKFFADDIEEFKQAARQRQEDADQEAADKLEGVFDFFNPRNFETQLREGALPGIQGT